MKFRWIIISIIMSLLTLYSVTADTLIFNSTFSDTNINWDFFSNNSISGSISQSGGIIELVGSASEPALHMRTALNSASYSNLLFIFNISSVYSSSTYYNTFNRGPGNANYESWVDFSNGGAFRDKDGTDYSIQPVVSATYRIQRMKWNNTHFCGNSSGTAKDTTGTQMVCTTNINTNRTVKMSFVSENTNAYTRISEYILCDDTNNDGVCELPAGPGVTINISDSSPINLSSFNTNPVFFNVYANLSYTNTNASLYINGTLNQTKTLIGSGTNVNISFNTSFSDGKFTYFISVYDNTTNKNSSAKTFWIDLINPLITFITPNSTNTTVIHGNLSTNISLNDVNLYSYYFNISWYNGTVIYNISNTSLTGLTNFNITRNFNMLNFSGLFLATVRTCDGHTDKNIAEYINNIDGEIISFDVLKENVKITPLDASKAYTNKKTDRYTFKFDHKTVTDTFIYLIGSNQYIDIVNDKSKYNGHLITGNKWIDFETDNIKSVIVERINNNKVQVTVKLNYFTKSIEYNSIGELNCNQQTVKFTSINYIQNNISSVITGSNNIYYLNLSYNTTFAGTASATLWYNNTAYTPTSSVSSNLIQFQKTITAISIEKNLSYYWTYNIGSYYFNTTQINQSVYPFAIDNCTTYSMKWLNITFKDSNTSALINTIINYKFIYTYEGITNTYNLSANSQSSYKFCYFPNSSNFTTDIILQYYAQDYASNFWYQNSYIVDNVTNYQILYLTPTSIATGITISVIDSLSNNVIGAVVEAYKYDLATDSYTLIASEQTDNSGQAKFYLNVATDQYRFLVKRNNILVYTSETMKLISTSYTFQLASDVSEVTSQYILNTITRIFSYTDALLNGSVTYNDWLSVANSYSVEVYFSNATNSTLISNITSVSHSSVLNFTIPNITGTYSVNFYATYAVDNVKYFIEGINVYIKPSRTASIVIGTDGLILTFILVGTLFFIGVTVSAEIAFIFSLIGFIAMFWLDFITFANGTLAFFGIICCFILMIYRGYRR